MKKRNAEMSSKTIVTVVITLTGALLFFIYIISKTQEIKTALLG